MGATPLFTEKFPLDDTGAIDTVAWKASRPDDASKPGSTAQSPAFTAAPTDNRAAAAALLGASWPARGRHIAQMALAGALVRGGWSDEEAVDFLSSVCKAAGDEDRPKRSRSVREARSKRDVGLAYTGFATLMQIIDKDVVGAARKLVGLTDSLDIACLEGLFEDERSGIPEDPLNFQSGSLKKIPWNDVQFMLSQGADWKGVFRFNVLTRRNVAVNPPFPMCMSNGGLSDEDVLKIRNWFARQGLGASKEAIIDGIAVTCKEKGRDWNPFKEYLDGLPSSSGVLATVHATVLGLPDDPLAGVLLIKALVAAARRALGMPKVGMKTIPVDHQGVLVLSGKQGIGKGRLVKILAGDWYHTIDVSRLKDKDTVIKAQGSVLAELEEMSTSAGDRDALKRFLSAADDFERAPFQKSAEKVPRSYSLIATTNDARLEDPTGHRRMWVVAFPEGAVIDWQAAERLRDAIWREIYDRARTDFSHHLTPQEAALCADRAQGLEVEEGNRDLIIDAVAGKTFVTTREVYDHITKGTKSSEMLTRGQSLEISATLRRLGCKQQTQRIGDTTRKAWCVPVAYMDIPVSEAGVVYRNAMKAIEEASALRKN